MNKKIEYIKNRFRQLKNSIFNRKNKNLYIKSFKIALLIYFIYFFIYLLLNIIHLEQFIGFSGYDYENPPIFFSIGEALSALAILFAVYQFKKEKWSISLNVKSYIKKYVIICIILGFIFSVISSLTFSVVPDNICQKIDSSNILLGTTEKVNEEITEKIKPKIIQIITYFLI
jgi:hypothetical protein